MRQNNINNDKKNMFEMYLLYTGYNKSNTYNIALCVWSQKLGFCLITVGSSQKQKVQVKGRTEIQLESAHRVEITHGAGVTGGC